MGGSGNASSGRNINNNIIGNHTKSGMGILMHQSAISKFARVNKTNKQAEHSMCCCLQTKSQITTCPRNQNPRTCNLQQVALITQAQPTYLNDAMLDANGACTNVSGREPEATQPANVLAQSGMHFGTQGWKLSWRARAHGHTTRQFQSMPMGRPVLPLGGTAHLGKIHPLARQQQQRQVPHF